MSLTGEGIYAFEAIPIYLRRVISQLTDNFSLLTHDMGLLAKRSLIYDTHKKGSEKGGAPTAFTAATKALCDEEEPYELVYLTGSSLDIFLKVSSRW